MLQHQADVQDVHKIPLLILFENSLLDFVFESLLEEISKASWGYKRQG
jgi:hypothetical protein